MNYQHELKNNVLILNIDGDILGESNGAELVDLVNKQIEGGAKNAAVDLSQVRYMNSTGLSVLISLHNTFKGNGGKLALVNPSEQVSKMLTITKLNTIFSVYSSQEIALTSL